MTHEPFETGDKGECRVCHGPAAGLYFGAIVCLPCKSFYIRCTKDGVKLRCQQDPSACTVNKGRFKCQACRFQACLAAGMQRKEEKPDVIDAPAGSVMCKVCDDFANGVHFGVTSCEGCKKFFRRGLTEYQNYACKEDRNCPITPRTRNQCRYCRYMACINAGMSREAIKVGRPPSKKENSRHHPYGQLNLSMNPNSSTKLSYENGFVKQEIPWASTEVHSLSSLPALIHGGGEGFRRQQLSMKLTERQVSDGLNNSCTSADMNEILASVLGPSGEMPPLPAHFDLDEALVQIDSPYPPELMAKNPPKLQRIENLPSKHQYQQQQMQNYQQAPVAVGLGHGKANFQLQSVKSESRSYREPAPTFSHPSPPYEATYEQYHSPPSMYQQSYPNSHPPQGSPYSQPSPPYSHPNHGSPINTLAQQNRVITQSTNGYGLPIANQRSPQQQTVAYDMSAGNHMSVDQSNNPQMTNGDTAPYHSPTHRQQAFTHPSPGPAPYGSHRPSCDLVVQQQQQQQQLQPDPHSPYSQQQYSPYSLSSNASSPQSIHTNSGYATDSQDFLDEFSIYEVDIRQVNHKYMPSCSYEPLTFNEQAFIVELAGSKNTKKEHNGEEGGNLKDMETGESSSTSYGTFKHMKSIDDKINQDYWFKHEMPEEIEYTENMQTEMDRLMKGWYKTKEYVNQRTSSSSEEGKESLWPNVKENAPLQLKLMEFIKNRLIRETQAQARFYQEIKGSDVLPEKDKKTLVSTASFSNCLLMHIYYWWDEEREQCKYFWAWRIPEKDPFYVFRQTVLKLSRAIKDLNFDEKEIMLVSALTLFSTDVLRIEQKDVIEKERKPLTDLCAAYMKDKYKGNYLKRYRQMLTMIPALRYLSIWHNDLMAFAKTFGPITDRPKIKSVERADLNSDYEHSVTMIEQLRI